MTEKEGQEFVGSLITFHSKTGKEHVVKSYHKRLGTEGLSFPPNSRVFVFFLQN